MPPKIEHNPDEEETVTVTESHIIRLALLEEQLKRLIETQEKRDAKLDELLALKHKGLGAIWFASLILGTSFIGAVTALISWFKG